MYGKRYKPSIEAPEHADVVSSSSFYRAAHRIAGNSAIRTPTWFMEVSDRQ